MKLFQSAFSAWLDNHRKNVSLRALAIKAGVDVSMLSLVRKGTHHITFNALQKLLPAIESFSTRHSAITLHLAYLADETVDAYREAIRIEAIGSDGHTTLDTYAQLAADWEERARNDTSFYAMWLGMDNFMHHPERQAIDFDPQNESNIALLAEPVSTYHTTTRGSHPQDIDRLDSMPSQHAAQEHEQD